MGARGGAADGGFRHVPRGARARAPVDELHEHDVPPSPTQGPHGHDPGAGRHRLQHREHVQLRRAVHHPRVQRRADRRGGVFRALLHRRRAATPVVEELRFRRRVELQHLLRLLRRRGHCVPDLQPEEDVAHPDVHAQFVRPDSVRGGDEDGPLEFLRGRGEAAPGALDAPLLVRHLFLRMRRVLPRDPGRRQVRLARRGRRGRVHHGSQHELGRDGAVAAVLRRRHPEHRGVRRPHPGHEPPPDFRHRHDR